MTKETLLKYEGFIDNEFLTEYVNFINSVSTDSTAFEKHHVIPACWYRLRFNLTMATARNVANRDPVQHIVKLSLAQHTEAHRLLSLCTTGKLKESLDFAYTKMQQYGFDGTEPAKDRYARRKAVHSIAKTLRQQSNYKKTWDQCLEEASKIYCNLEN